MTSTVPKRDCIVRSLQYRDWEAVSSLLTACGDRAERSWLSEPLQYGNSPWSPQPLTQVLDLLPGQWSASQRTCVLEQQSRIIGLIQVAPFNRARSTWRVERICVDPSASSFDAGTQLLRYCLEKIWEARTWLVEVEVNHVEALGLYRQNGFQPLVQMTRWQFSAEALAQLADHSPTLPNLLPVNNVDASLLYQLDTAAMPPFVRQVFDRHLQDFQRGVFSTLADTLRTHIRQQDRVNGYIFEPQRKAAIGYFAICLARGESSPHTAQLTVHPAYTWLYPELMAHMASLAQQFCPNTAMALVSADYQPEREDYLQQMGAERVEHTLMLSRSVWHKVRESKTLSLETLQLTEMLQGLQPNHTPVPGRWTFLTTLPSPLHTQGGTVRSSNEHRAVTQREALGAERKGSRPSSDMPDPHGSCG